MATIKEAIEYSKVNPNSAFATELRRRMESGEMDKELQGVGLVQFMSKPPEKTVLQEVGSNLKERGTKMLETSGREDVSFGEKVLRNSGNVVGAVGDVVAPVIGAGLKATGLDKPLGEVAQSVAGSEIGQAVGDIYGGLSERTQENLGAVGNIASVIPVTKGAQIASNLAKTGAKATGNAIATGANAVVDNAVVNGISTVAKSTGESLKRIPERMATNVAEKQATEAAIKELPTKTAQTAVRDGVDITDVKEISNITRTPQVNKLIDTVKRFAAGDKTVDPIEVVGSPMVQRVKTLDADRKVIGKQLGEASKTIGVLTKPELQSGVLSRLQSVPGLEELTLTPKGLSFKGTTLESALSQADRKAISQAFTEATKWGDGIKAHNFRQTLFENLGGKKKSLANITDTQERAFEAIRSGLSDVIELKSPKYKSLSNEYRKIVQPLGDLRKLMKNIDQNSTEDILNMSAGLLARRITSAASSNPQIKQILSSLDNAGITKGTTKESVTQLQDMYNILNKYYDIAPKTGFQNLVKEGVGASDSIAGMTKEALKNVAGQSNAVRQKALEKLLEELGVVMK